MNKSLQYRNRNLEALKEYAYCKCMEQTIKTFSKVDSFEAGSGAVKNIMDSYGLYSKIIDPIFDSLVFIVIKKQIETKYDNSIYKHESSMGTTSYILECLSFYNSTKLDSVVKSIPKELYVVDLDK
jgi:hypothetical protein